MSDVLAILSADWHLSEKPPIARSVEDNWYGVMARQLEELRQLSAMYECPIIIAGDTVNTWYEPASLINFALAHIPSEYGVWAVAGQHCLPNHSWNEIKRSAFWTLIEAGIIGLIQPECCTHVSNQLGLYGFSWGYPITPCPPKREEEISVAVIHHYVYKPPFGHPKAKEEDNIFNWKEQLEGYDIAVVGDNHTPFEAQVGNCQVFNCGGFFRRKSDERDHKPSVGLLKKSRQDLWIERHYLDVSKDVFLEHEEAIKAERDQVDTENLLMELGKLGDAAINFRDAVHQSLRTNMPTDSVQRIILDCMERKGK